MANQKSYKEIEIIIDQVAVDFAKKAMVEFEVALAKAEQFGYHVTWDRDGSAMIFDGNGEPMLDECGYSRWELFVPAIRLALNKAKVRNFSIADFRNLLKGKLSVPYGSWYSWQIDIQQDSLAQERANYEEAETIRKKISKLKAQILELEASVARLI